MKFRVVSLASCLAFCVVAACSSTPASTPTDDSGTAPDDTMAAAETTPDTASAPDTGATDTATTPETPAASLKAPKLTMVMKMMGVLHAMWTNNQTDCDSIEMERKDDMTAYKVVFTLAGDLDNKMDSGASANMTYTYRLRCKKGADYSPYSNEMSANPTK